MPYSIEIKEGAQTSDDVLFTPASIDKPFSFTDKDVITCNDAFFINATDVEIHLLSFLKKYYDVDFVYNKEYRIDGMAEIPEGFKEYYFNFYTYSAIQMMCDEITNYVNQLKMQSVKDCFVQSEIISFYLRFVTRTQKMMNDHPKCHLISILHS